MKPTAMVYRAPPVFQAQGGPMADFKHRRDRGIVRFSGELNHAAAVDSGRDGRSFCTRVYFYDLIETSDFLTRRCVHRPRALRRCA